MSLIKKCFFFFFLSAFSLHAAVELGVDVFFQEGQFQKLKGKKIALLVNQTSVNQNLKNTFDLFIENANDFTIQALFSPEHGFSGLAYAGEKVEGQNAYKGIPIYSLHGASRRASKEMLQGLDAIIFDIQEIGSRSYTYATTLYYMMEEAAKKNIAVIVLDRPNPMNGLTVEGPLLQEKFRSFVGYVNVPYCHGMTIGELAHFFNEEYKIGCSLSVVPMKGWKREMSFQDTGLHWIPTSPNIPEWDTPFFYASTGILGVLEIVNIGVGYTLPFKLVGAPWIKAEDFALKLNRQKLPGVTFMPFYYRPFEGPYKGKNCQGVKICITDTLLYKPLTVQYLLMGMLKALYPNQVNEKLSSLSCEKIKFFCKINGNREMFGFLKKERYPAWQLMHFQEGAIKVFKKTREKYLLY